MEDIVICLNNDFTFNLDSIKEREIIEDFQLSYLDEKKGKIR